MSLGQSNFLHVISGNYIYLLMDSTIPCMVLFLQKQIGAKQTFLKDFYSNIFLLRNDHTLEKVNFYISKFQNLLDISKVMKVQ